MERLQTFHKVETSFIKKRYNYYYVRLEYFFYTQTTFIGYKQLHNRSQRLEISFVRNTSPIHIKKMKEINEFSLFYEVFYIVFPFHSSIYFSLSTFSDK